MNPKWKGALIGGIIGLILAFIFSFIRIGTSFCVTNKYFEYISCSISATAKEFGIISAVISAPRLFIKGIFNLTGFGEMLIFPIMALIFIVVSILISFWRFKKK
jgi:hypothetical protein